MKKIDWFNVAIGLTGLATFVTNLFTCKDDAVIKTVLVAGIVASVIWLLLFSYHKKSE